MQKEIAVKMIDPKLDRLKFTEDWVDVRTSSITEINASKEQVSKCRTILQKAQVCPY